MPEYRWIESLHNIHKGEEIWVLGTGWSLDEFPDDFFRDKLAIAHRFAYRAFFYCNYLWFGYNEPRVKEFIRNQDKSVFERIIFGLGRGIFPHRLKWAGGNRKYSIYMKKKEVESAKKFEDEIEKMKKRITCGRPCRYPNHATSIHFPIEAAIVMGASKITLAGASHRCEKGKVHAKNRGVPLYYPHDDTWPPRPNYAERQAKHRFGTALLARVFKPYGISIRRYYYGKGYEEIV